jgi:hypothetical protein
MASALGKSLYIGLKADTKGFGKSLSAAERRMKTFKNAAKIVGTAVAASFAAMGAAALLFGKSAITAALEDQKSQVLLAKTIKNNAKGRKGLIKDSEKTISALESQYNIVDDKLRPAFSKLVIATKSVSKSQKLIRTAIDVSALSGKSLDAVVTALSKSYLGSNTALTRLGLGIDKAKLKTMSFDQVIAALTKKTGGAGKAAAGTYQGAVDGLSIAWNNFQESVGYKILPKLKSLLTYIKEDLLPWLGELKKGFTGSGQEQISPKLRSIGRAMGFEPGKSKAFTLGESLKKMTEAFTLLFTALTGAKNDGSLSTLYQLAVSLTKIANAITKVTNAVGGAKSWWDKWGGLVGTLTGADPGSFGPRNNSQGSLYVPPASTPSARRTSAMGSNTTIHLNGIVDAESARRSIEQLMRKSSLRTGTVNLNGSIF